MNFKWFSIHIFFVSVAAVLFKYLNNFNLDICHYCQISYKSKNSSKLASSQQTTVQENPAFTLMTSHNHLMTSDRREVTACRNILLHLILWVHFSYIYILLLKCYFNRRTFTSNTVFCQWCNSFNWPEYFLQLWKRD